MFENVDGQTPTTGLSLRLKLKTIPFPMVLIASMTLIILKYMEAMR